MNQHLRIGLALTLIIGCFSVRAQDAKEFPSLNILKFKFEAAKGELEKPIRDLNEKYAASLKSLQEKVRKAGKLDQTLEVKNELEGFASGKTKPAEDFDELRRLQTIYAEQSERLKRNLKRDLKPLLASYRKNLASLKEDLTKQNKLEEAVATAKEEERSLALLENVDSSGLATEEEAEQGLRLTVGDETEIWKNEIVALPGQTPIWFTGTLKLPEKVEVLRLRPEKAYGSDRLFFTVSGKELKFEVEVSSKGNNRFVTFEVPEGVESLSLKIGKDSVSNQWEWGPLQWSIDNRSWRDVPLRNLAVE